MRRVVERQSPLSGVRVLLVEDHALVREAISLLLVEYGAEVTATSGAVEALQVFERERPDCMISGIDMPGDDGYALMRTLRALPRDRGGRTPAIALTGWTRVEDRDRVLRAGFQFFMPKPVDARVLVSVVASLAARIEAVEKSPGPIGVSLGA
jgi:CheY-like chemotaxis protein